MRTTCSIGSPMPAITTTSCCSNSGSCGCGYRYTYRSCYRTIIYSIGWGKCISLTCGTHTRCSSWRSKLKCTCHTCHTTDGRTSQSLIVCNVTCCWCSGDDWGSLHYRYTHCSCYGIIINSISRGKSISLAGSTCTRCSSWRSKRKCTCHTCHTTDGRTSQCLIVCNVTCCWCSGDDWGSLHYRYTHCSCYGIIINSISRGKSISLAGSTCTRCSSWRSKRKCTCHTCHTTDGRTSQCLIVCNVTCCWCSGDDWASLRYRYTHRSCNSIIISCIGWCKCISLAGSTYTRCCTWRCKRKCTCHSCHSTT